MLYQILRMCVTFLETRPPPAAPSLPQRRSYNHVMSRQRKTTFNAALGALGKPHLIIQARPRTIIHWWWSTKSAMPQIASAALRRQRPRYRGCPIYYAVITSGILLHGPGLQVKWVRRLLMNLLSNVSVFVSRLLLILL